MKSLWVAVLVAFMASSTVPSSLWAASPVEQIKTTVEDVLRILKDPRLQGDNQKKERQARLNKVLFPSFDFVEMAKRSLGIHWPRNVASRAEMVPYFSELVTNAYVNQIDSYKNEKIVYLRERMEDRFADVDTRIMTGRASGVPIVYKLRFTEGNWKIYDLTIDNMSWVNGYRSQLNRILAISSFDAFLKSLQKKGSTGDGDLRLKMTNGDKMGNRIADSGPGLSPEDTWQKALPLTLFLLREASGPMGLRP